MYTLPESIKILYRNNPERFEIKMQALWENICSDIAPYNLTKETMDQLLKNFDRIKQNAWDFHLHPDSQDIIKLIDNVYKNQQRKTLGESFEDFGKNPRKVNDIRPDIDV